jgi:hypothetical protein
VHAVERVGCVHQYGSRKSGGPKCQQRRAHAGA